MGVQYESSQWCKICRKPYNLCSTKADVYHICDECYKNLKKEINHLEELYLRGKELSFWKRVMLKPIESVSYKSAMIMKERRELVVKKENFLKTVKKFVWDKKKSKFQVISKN